MSIIKDQFRLMLIDDDFNDTFFVKLALKKAGLPEPVYELTDGVAGIQLLESLAATPEAWPHIIVMDLKMPRMNGDEVLGWVRRHPLYKELPVIILTSSDEIADMTKTSRLGILKFLTKEVHCDNLVSVLERFIAT